ncbi:MAG TPA: alpha/beta hydrolase [Acidobacteriaceae bacterium]|nr:alpha/beta hydrolase [Acidobacteriaceae bacterium]
MDGTSELFLEFMRVLPLEIRKEAPTYPRDHALSYQDLAQMVRYITFESETFVSEPFVLVAESFSTPVAIQIAAEHPPKLRALILCAGFATSPVRGPQRWLMSLLAHVFVRASFSDSAIRFALVGEDAPPSLVDMVRAAISSVRPEVLAARLRALLACDTRSELAAVSVPILYLQANRDRLVKPRCLDEMRRANPSIRPIEVDGPHLLLQREPQKTAKIVAKFLRELD